MIRKAVSSDGRLDRHEDRLAHTPADLPRLDHSQFIGARLKVKEALKRGKWPGKRRQGLCPASPSR